VRGGWFLIIFVRARWCFQPVNRSSIKISYTSSLKVSLKIYGIPVKCHDVFVYDRHIATTVDHIFSNSRYHQTKVGTWLFYSRLYTLQALMIIAIYFSDVEIAFCFVEVEHIQLNKSLKRLILLWRHIIIIIINRFV